MNDKFALRSAADLGRLLKLARQQQGLAQTAVAEWAGISRQHFSEIENGKAVNVELPTLLNLLAALQLSLTAGPSDQLVRVAQYEQLRDLCWNRDANATITEEEALSIYERNWRFIDRARLKKDERQFLDRIVRTQGNGVLLV